MSRLLLRATLGAVATKDFISVPPSLRFYAGGEDSVRGYPYNSLGPLAVPFDPDSNQGGRYLLLLAQRRSIKFMSSLAERCFLIWVMQP